MNVPNLDAMTPDDLWEFSTKYSRAGRSACEALVGKRTGYTVIAHRLANYACNKAVAMRCRLRGDISAAMMYETICDGIYVKLPEDCRW